ncbi:MAG TPA: histidine kinase [Chitinophagaceae bacterium]
MLHRFLNMISFLSIAIATYSQQLDKGDFKVYRAKDGLSSNNINVITQDPYGYIWIGTEKGLNRFDGSGFQQFYADSLPESLPEDRVFNLKLINNEELAVLTGAGLHIINTKTLQSRNIIIPADSTIDRAIVNRIFDVAGDKEQNLFILTSAGFYHYHAGTLVFRYDTTTQTGFGWDLVRADNTVLLSTAHGLYIYDIQKKELHSLADNDDPLFQQVAKPKQTFRFIYNHENYFAASNANGDDFALFDITKKTRQVIGPPINGSKKIDPNGKVFRLNDTLLAISSNPGYCLLHFDRQTGSWNLDTTIYFENIFITALLLDKNNRLWVSTHDGLYKQNKPGGRIEQAALPGDNFSIQRSITGLAVANNKVFVATVADGIYVYSKDSFLLLKHFLFPKGQNFITSLLKVNEDALMTAGTCFLINTRNLDYKKVQADITKRTGYFRSIMKDSHDRLYFTKYRIDTLYFKDPSDNKISELFLPELKKLRTPTQMAEDADGNIWLGGQGLIRLNRRSNKVDLFLDSFPFIKRPVKEISSNLVFDKNGKMYFGVFGNGLIIYDLKNKTYSRLTRLDGLPDNVIMSLFLYGNRTLWIATENGLASYDLDSKKISSFGASDGMPTDFNSCRTLYFDPVDSLLYADFVSAIVRFDPIKLKKNQTPPEFFVESISFTGKDPFYHPDNNVIVSYKYNSAVINLAAINYEDASQQLFAYRLLKKGDESWQEIGTQRSIFLNDLPAGKHNLQVKVYLRNQSWPDQVKELTIIVRPPFWKTIWFYISITLLIAAILYYLHRLRIGQLTQKANVDKQLAQTEMKALHAQMNPHFIFNCLNSIREMILNNENKQASLYLSKFARLIRITLNQSSQQFVSLNDTIDYLERYIEMEKIRSNHFSYTTRVDEHLQKDEILVPPMLIQPFIENAIWHGAPHKNSMHINVHFFKNETELICTIDDNGVGINESLLRRESIAGENPVGIANIRQRIELLNEKYNLQSTLKIEDKSSLSPGNGTGTLVTLYLPLKTNENLWTS